MIRRNALSVLCIAVCFMIPEGAAAESADVGEAGSAMVQVEELAVYPRPLEAGVAIKFLKKGEAVFTNLEIMGSDGEAWCAIAGDADMAVTGYAKCDGLKMGAPSAPELWREIPQSSAPAESVRGVPSLPPAALPPSQSEKLPIAPAR